MVIQYFLNFLFYMIIVLAVSSLLRDILSSGNTNLKNIKLLGIILWGFKNFKLW